MLPERIDSGSGAVELILVNYGFAIKNFYKKVNITNLD